MDPEFTRIAEIRRRLMKPAEGLLIGIGDDAAVMAPSDAKLVYSVDSQVEDVHFCRPMLGLADIGYRSFVAALSDLAAMGAMPKAALVALVLPQDFSDNQLYTLIDGISEATKTYQTAVIGGNLSSGKQLSIHTTVIGHSKTDVLRRQDAQLGDWIHVTGTIGSAALGLHCLVKGLTSQTDRFISRWRRPVARIMEGQRLLAKASAMIDISDGLIQDLGHICQASDVAAEIYSHLLPVEDNFFEIGKKVITNPIELALCGGEDYELVFTAPSQTIEGLSTTCIGKIVSAPPSVKVKDEKGCELNIDKVGYQHWKGSTTDVGTDK